MLEFNFPQPNHGVFLPPVFHWQRVRKALSARARGLAVKNLTWVFDKA